MKNYTEPQIEKIKNIPFDLTINLIERQMRISKKTNNQQDFKEIILNEDLEIIGCSNRPIKG